MKSFTESVIDMIKSEIKDTSAKIIMEPPEGKFTLLNVETIKALIDVLDELAESPAKTVRIQGRGGCFAVGADLKTMYNYDGFVAKGFSMLGNSLFSRMRSMNRIIIAEIDGFCMGGGMDFASACDFRFATASSRFAHPGSKLGIITGFGGTQSISRQMKSAYTSEFFATGDMYPAQYMKEGGFVSEVFESAESMNRYVDDFCSKTAKKSRELLSGLKAQYC